MQILQLKTKSFLYYNSMNFFDASNINPMVNRRTEKQRLNVFEKRRMILSINLYESFLHE
jgi:hypothetical protein